jgi:hypothetical protein
LRRLSAAVSGMTMLPADFFFFDTLDDHAIV